ncbi:hypothetical protein Poli38472_001994 [Pythium oligandrum]|uniref:Uncharacterized protein n=1 Tax=Pythium oligandrum TaxID=41045 RepID=A0A8K1FTR0_PYTOL|nr:hypothetical protein Poli38472_001994 [Pythium oligandrum]|eukprot:TMW69838.1 hypothetical protein Poli38472_001994 [Pythium oligandrum]
MNLYIRVLFKKERDALIFYNALHDESITMGSPLYKQEIEAHIVPAPAAFSPLRRVLTRDYNPAETDSPENTASNSSVTSIVDMATDMFKYQRIEHEGFFGHLGKAQSCHLMSHAHCQDHTSYEKYDKDESNRLALSSEMHGWFVSKWQEALVDINKPGIITTEQRDTRMMDVGAIEEAFLSGDWALVLEESKTRLVDSVGVDDAATNGADGVKITSEQEQLLSLYLQSVFELGKQDELETLAILVISLKPLPFHVSLQWIKFLIAMDRKPAALEVVNDLLETYTAEIEQTQSDDSRQRYLRTMEVLVIYLLIPNESIEVVERVVNDDPIIDGVSKKRLLESLRVRTSSTTNSTPQDSCIDASSSSAIAEAWTSSQPQPRTNTNQRSSHAMESDNDSSMLFTVGGAIAIGAVAIGLYRSRHRLHEAIENIKPALSKVLEDAKYALFES